MVFNEVVNDYIETYKNNIILEENYVSESK